MDSSQKNRIKTTHFSMGLVIVNLVLIICIALLAATYSQRVVSQKNALKLDSFCSSVQNLRSVSENYLQTEKGYVDDWAAYITAKDMDAFEAIDYITTTNTHLTRAAHLVDVETWSALTTEPYNGNPWVKRYLEMKQAASLGDKNSEAFLEKLKQAMDPEPGQVIVHGKYRVGEASQRTVISVGAPVSIRQEDGSHKTMLLLRLIPLDYMQNSWILPTAFASAEVSLISRNGNYVIPSPAFRSANFLEFIRGYNFQDDYNKMYDLARQLESTDSGLLQYKNSAGEDCFFYYTLLGQGSNVFVVGYAPVAQVMTTETDWSIVLLVCGSLLFLALVDGAYILSINRKLRGAVATAERASQAKTDFLSTMSHDIRTPMNAVIGMTEVAKLHLDDPEYARSCLNKVETSGRHLLTLINDILDLSKVESGKMTLSPCAFSLRDAAEEVYSMSAQDARDKGLMFTLDLGEFPCDTILADPLRVRQVLLNLLSNAIKYTPSGGHVRFGVRQQAEGETAKIDFTVADDGMGMSEEFQKEMYTSFFRATNSRINAIQGSGLGLSIVKQLVELMHGSIDCQSAPEKGTTFVVHLSVPVAAEQQTAPADTATVSAEALSGMRVLVAEDNELNWQIIQALLEEHQIQADRAVNGIDCISLMETAPARYYDLIFMDVQMPVMDGREATRRLRSSSRRGVRTVPIIAMTADAFAEDIQACLKAGMDGHISKPVEMKQVLRYLAEVKNGTLYRKEDIK